MRIGRKLQNKEHITKLTKQASHYETNKTSEIAGNYQNKECITKLAKQAKHYETNKTF